MDIFKRFAKDFYIQYIDGVPFRLKAPFEFSFLSKYGRVFKVFDAQDSGNICFGVKKEEKSFFIKFAGAPTERASVSAGEAIANLKRTLPIYKDLAHPTLIRYIGSEEIGGGFAMVFDWVDAECMGRMYPLSHRKFMAMPLETRIGVFEEILAFHIHTAAQGYVAVDFYDGSILYDFSNGKTVICDIDFYTKMPYTNPVGRLWGSSLFMSPEEFQLGAVIDEVTNIYTMGAVAFALFAEYDRSPESWPLDQKLYEVVKKAVSDEREGRQQSIRQLMEEWGLKP
ncbi:MAG: serine/threonine protein kinase [Oscillospiraceae bacterium]|jgi:serine/threonine-protein kinase|nr:serine/threonine protein kinase [Oscillospiraceae bacterium]